MIAPINNVEIPEYEKKCLRKFFDPSFTDK
jgi:hypothetical protein